MRRGALIVLLLWLAMLVAASSAAGAYHLMKIREVHEGGGTEADYVELQMYDSGQGFVSGRYIATYDSAGNEFVSYQLPGNVANGSNQRSILIAGTGAIAATPDFTVPVANVFPSAGSACFIDTLPSNGIDCVTIGTAAAPTTNPSPVGTPVLSGTSGLAPGQSVERSIARGCATLLEASDDTNDSAADFALAPPSPRPNSVAPTETACGGDGDGGGDDKPPNTKIKKGPRGEVETDTVKFKFKANEPGSTFRCRLDRKKYKPCNSPKKLKNLDDGKHTFYVRATDTAGNTDPSPAKRRFEVVG